MLLIIDKNTGNVVMNFGTNSVYPDGNFPSLQELPIEQEYIKIHDNSDIAQKIKSSYKYNLIFDSDDKVIDINIIKTKEQYQQEQLNNIDIVKQNKKSELSQSCQNAITGGFNSTAYQNVNKVYDSTLEDQANITGNALSAVSKVSGVPGCANDTFYYHARGEEFVEWQPEECLQLARDFKIFKEQQLIRNKQLQAYVETLATTEEVQAITWDTVIPT